MIRQNPSRATRHSSPNATLARNLLSWGLSALQRWISFLALTCLSCSAALAQTASYHCPAGMTLGPWKVVQSLGAGSFNLFPYGPCTLGEAFASPDAAAAACSPTGPFDANIVWAPQTLLVTPLGSADGSSSSFLVGFTENSYSTINGQETVIEFLGRVAAYCTAAQYFVQVPQTPPPSRADAGPSCPACVNAPDPVNPSSGNEFLVETDIEPIGSHGTLGFKRFYSSINTDAGDLGAGWGHSFSRRLVLESGDNSSARSSLYASAADACTSGWAEVRAKAPGLQLATAAYANGGCTLSLNGEAVMALPVQSQVSPLGGGLTAIHAYRDDGRVLNFTASGGTFTAEPGVDYRLVSTADGGYQLTDEQDDVETYDSSGRLLSIADRAGNTETLSYDSSGALLSVTDNFGHALSFAYDGAGRLASVTAPDGGSVRYGYDGAGHLATVTNLDGSTRQYLYDDPNWPNGISGVVDESGQAEFALSYDSQGRVVSSTLGGVSSSMSFVYNSDGSTTETDSLGAVRTFGFQQVGDHRLSGSVSGAPCFRCGYVAATTYDSGGYPSSETDFRGDITQYVYDDARGLETSRTEGTGTSAARTTVTQWNDTFRLPAQMSLYAGSGASGTPTRTTLFAYDGAGNLLSKTVTDPALGISRTWTYTYDSYGRVLTAQDSRSNVTTFTYYTCATGAQCGELRTITDALGHVTTYDSYDADGRPLTITDPNGTVTALAYDARGHLTSRSVAGQMTSFEYFPTGLLEKVTLADGSSLSYAYDAAHRLIGVSDALGNKIAYTVDAMGNRTAEYGYDPSGVLHRTHTRVINSLNDIEQEINAAGSSAVATTFGYDENGNPTSIDAPLGRNTSQSYDALNRVVSITDPAGGLSAFGYDAEDEITRVTDPRGLVTSYGYDGLGDLVSQTSPDSGMTTNTYDAAGNLATSTDARGAVATYGYDALNRVTSISYSLNGSVDQKLSFTYDQGTDGIGHLSGASDANHSMAFSYDALGEMTGVSQTVAGVSRSIAYEYANGDLTSITTPSGQRITYSYNSDHQVAGIAVNGKILLSSVSYEPFGPVDGWTWGNGRTITRTYDGDGNIVDITGSGGEELLSYDDAARISGVTYAASNGVRGSDWTYGYDDLDRLSSATNGALAEGWTYDADGNRLSQTDRRSLTYSISPTSNKIDAVTTGGLGSATLSYRYDLAGNTLQGPRFKATYNDAGRLDTLTEGFQRTAFTYNALGEMIEARGSLGTTLYVYDEAGHLLGEYDRRGGLIQETVWLGDIPVATLRPRGRSVAIFYVQTDQLDTPREVIRPRDNAVIWRWCSDPFGNNLSGRGAGPGRRNQASCAAASGRGRGPAAGALRAFRGFSYDLRFPGQIAGMWGSTFQNYRRDYDPAAGRYVESDPIGLAGGGFSTYAYTGGNPISRTDPLGLTWGDDWYMFWDWASGNAPPDTVYGPDTNQTKDMMQSPGVAAAINYFNQKNAGRCPNQRVPVRDYAYKFGLKGLWKAGLNSTQQFVGSYGVNVYPNADGTLNVDVYNTTSMTSFLYGIYPNLLNPPNGWPMGNATQRYDGVMSDPAGAGCGCRSQ